MAIPILNNLKAPHSPKSTSRHRMTKILSCPQTLIKQKMHILLSILLSNPNQEPIKIQNKATPILYREILMKKRMQKWSLRILIGLKKTWLLVWKLKRALLNKNWPRIVRNIKVRSILAESKVKVNRTLMAKVWGQTEINNEATKGCKSQLIGQRISIGGGGEAMGCWPELHRRNYKL